MPDNDFLDVRKAYRLLYDYQARVLSLVKFIGSSYKIPYAKGFPKFSSKGSGNLGNWSWDWLNMYYYEFHFEKNKGENKVWFSVFLVSDTGFFDANKESKVSKLSVESFKKVNESETKLIFVAGPQNWNHEWGGYWDLGNFLFDESGHSESKDLVFKSYSLSSFLNEEGTLKQLKDFEQYCQQFEIPVKLSEKMLE